MSESNSTSTGKRSNDGITNATEEDVNVNGDAAKTSAATGVASANTTSVADDNTSGATGVTSANITNVAAANNTLGISPPGMKLRSGRKKKETPLKDQSGVTKTGTSKRRRGISEDGEESVADDEDQGGERMHRTKRRALDSAFERVEERENEDEEDDDDVQMNAVSDAIATTFTDAIAPAAVGMTATTETTAASSELDSETTTPSTARGLAQSLTSPPASASVTLRLPSQHTPAPPKIATAGLYKGNSRLKDFVTPAKPSAIAHVNVHGGADGLDAADASAHNTSLNGGTDSELEQMDLKRVAPVEIVQEEEERDEGRRDGLSHFLNPKKSSTGFKSMVNSDTVLWVIIALLLHISMMLTSDLSATGPLWVVMSDVPTVANHTLKTYRKLGILSEAVNLPEPEPIVIKDVVDNIVLVDNVELEEKERDLLRKRRKIAWWNAQKREADDFIETLDDDVDERLREIDGTNSADLIMGMIEDQTNEAKERTDKLHEWEKPLKKVHIVEENEDEDAVKKIIDDLLENSEMPLRKESVTILSFSDISVPGEGCDGEFILERGGVEEEYVTEDVAQEAKEELDALVTETYFEIRNEELFQPIADWMQIELDKFAEKNGFNKPLNLGHLISPSKPNKVKASSKRKNVLSVSGVQSIIDERLEIARADVTGKHDFASLRSGASVIYTGSRQTSPSLVQNLPLGNQVMAKLGLRFYGHGPDAALEPTFPRDSLGQCWSFEKEGERSHITIKEWAGDDEEFENEPDRGVYATLAVKLANPIYVKTVSIEHAPLALSKNRSTAIRKFRAIGFQSFDASGEPWLLGTFEYDSSKDEYLQEFDVQTKLENGLSVPRMGSIVLAIDSNWGADYSCLYRFRVNGQTRS